MRTCARARACARAWARAHAHAHAHALLSLPSSHIGFYLMHSVYLVLSRSSTCISLFYFRLSIRLLCFRRKSYRPQTKRETDGSTEPNHRSGVNCTKCRQTREINYIKSSHRPDCMLRLLPCQDPLFNCRPPSRYPANTQKMSEHLNLF